MRLAVQQRRATGVALFTAVSAMAHYAITAPPAAVVVPTYRVELVAGSTAIGDGGPASGAVLAGVGGIVATREFLYIADTGQNRVRAVDLRTGIIRTVAGSGLIEAGPESGPASSHSLLAPGPLALDAGAHTLYIAEVPHGRVTAVDLRSGIASRVPGPPGELVQPTGLLWTSDGLVVLDSLTGIVWLHRDRVWRQFVPEHRFSGGLRSAARRGDGPLFISEFFGRRIVRASGGSSPELSVVAESTTKASAGVDDRAGIGTPDGLAIDRTGRLHFADVGKSRVCRMTPAGGLEVVHASPAAGEGAWTPGAIAFDPDNRLYVADVRRRRVLRFDGEGARPVTIAGSDTNGDGGPATTASLGHPGRVAIDGDGHIYVSDALQHRIRRIDARTQRISTIAGTGVPGYNGDDVPAQLAQLNHPAGLLVERGVLYVADYYNHRLRAVDLQTGVIRTAAGTGTAADAVEVGLAVRTPLLNPHAVALDRSRAVLITSAVSSAIARFDPSTGTLAPVKLAGVAVPKNAVLIFYGISVVRDTIHLADGMRSALLRVDDGTVTRVRVGGTLNYPMDVAASPSGDLYVADTRNNRIVRVVDGRLEPVATGLGRPRGLAVTAEGDVLVADTFHNRVLRVRRAESDKAGR